MNQYLVIPHPLMEESRFCYEAFEERSCKHEVYAFDAYAWL